MKVERQGNMDALGLPPASIRLQIETDIGVGEQCLLYLYRNKV